jgi:multicomponent Na+:H+ antiporter subunit E
LVRALSLWIVLFATWLMLSGHFTALLISLGIASCALVVAITMKMEVVDREGHPLDLTMRAPLFWLWLLGEIIKANIDVTRRVLSPGLPVSPTLIHLRASQKSDLGLVIYANSITLTPGTVSVTVAPGRILVHALSREAAEELAAGDMDRRVTRMVGEAES